MISLMACGLLRCTAAMRDLSPLKAKRFLVWDFPDFPHDEIIINQARGLPSAQAPVPG